MSPKKAMLRFLSHLARVTDGETFEIGVMFDPRKGWRVYQRVGEVGLAMSAADARDLVRSFEKQALLPQWKAAAAELQPMFAEMKSCADDVDRKNREKVVPPDMPNVSPQWGHA